MPVPVNSTSILLATYNGAAYLPSQLDSLFAQTNQHWQLLVRDDGSKDETLPILHRYQAKYPNRIAIIPKAGENLGPCGNFAALLTEAETPYVMLCDQDDVWLPHKIETTLKNMQELERRHGASIPLLVHTDLKVVDKDLEPYADSLWRYQKTDPQNGGKLNRLLLQNVATGCTVMINRALRDKALPIPPEAIMHDWWLALTAAAFGRIGQVASATMLYRQHGLNDTGARQWHAGHLYHRLCNLERVREEMMLAQRQAAVFLARFGGQLPPADRATVAAYATLAQRGFFGKRRDLLLHDIRYAGVMRNIGLFVLA